MARLHHVGQDVRDLALLGRDVALQVAVERQKQQAVRADHPRDEVHHEEFHLRGGGGVVIINKYGVHFFIKHKANARQL